MSRGAGKVQRVIRDAFERTDFPVFDTSELCRIVYGTQVVEKKHRVAVIRALKGLAKGSLPSLWQWQPEFEKTDLVWYDYSRLPLRGPGRRPVMNPRRAGRA